MAWQRVAVLVGLESVLQSGMPSIKLDELEPYTRWVVPLILARYPEWEACGRVKHPLDGRGGVMEFEIACPSRAVDGGLWLSTENDELTVGFHTHNSHFSDYDTPKGDDHVVQALEEVSAYLEDRLGVVSWYAGQRPVGTTTCALPAPAQLPRVFDRHPVSHATLRSWSGRHDREEVVRGMRATVCRVVKRWRKRGK